MNMIDRAFSNTKYQPFWLDDIDAPEILPPLYMDIEADLLIVGAGFTGLWAAVQALEYNPNRKVVVIEAATIASGASGRPGAIVSTSVMHGLSNAERVFPDDLDLLEELGQKNMADLIAMLDKYGIDCDAEWTGELTVGVGNDWEEALKAEYWLNKKHGHNVEFLDEVETASHIASPIFGGALWSKDRSGILNPAKLAWGLREVALKLGAQIYENTPLIAVKPYGYCLRAKVPLADIIAKKILLATNAFAAGHRNIKRKVAAVRDRIVATEPLTSAQLNSIGWANRQGIYDTRTQMNYMRLTKDNRIIFGGKLAYFFWNNTKPKRDLTEKPYQKLAEAFFATFPQLEGISFSHAWSGPIALTTRMAVHFQRYHGNRMVYAGGYSGFGISASRFGAKIALSILEEHDDCLAKKLKLVTSQPNYIPPEPLRWLGAQITMYAMDTVDAKGGWRKHWINLVEKMGFPLN